MFEPMTLPTARSGWRRTAATIDVTSSGSEVPTATIVSPILSVPSPICPAMKVAPYDYRLAANREADGTGRRQPQTAEQVACHRFGLLGEASHLLLKVADLLFGRTEGEPHVDHQQPQQDHSVAPVDRAVQNQGKHEYGDQQHDRDVARHHAVRDSQGAEQRRRAQDETDIGQVGSEHVAHQQAAVALQRGVDRDDQLGRRGAQSDQCEADDDRADAHRRGDAGGTPHQPLGTEVEGAKTAHQVQDVRDRIRLRQPAGRSRGPS